MREKEYYKEKILKMLQEIDNIEALNFICIIIGDIVRDMKSGNLFK